MRKRNGGDEACEGWKQYAPKILGYFPRLLPTARCIMLQVGKGIVQAIEGAGHVLCGWITAEGIEEAAPFGQERL